jgi:DNA repair exonuclease SbcCD ATPase subunit
MGTVFLRRLTLQNFRSFEGLHSIDFEETGLYLVRGFNHDSRGESGAGKSTIFHAIAYVLDCAPYAATDLRCWHNEDPMFVELELMTSYGPMTIHRGDRLWIKSNGKKITSAKTVNEMLDAVCGMNKKMREAMTYRKQRTFGLFLSKKDSEKKEFLVELLQLHWLEEAIEEAVKKLSVATKERVSHEPIVELHKKLIDEAKARLPLENQRDTSDLEHQVERALLILRVLSDHRAILQTEIDTYKNIKFEYDSSELDRLQNLLKQCRSRIQRLGQPELLIQRAQREIFRLQSEIKRLFDDKCPRCDRQWDKSRIEMENNHQEIKRHEGHLQEAESQFRNLQTLKDTETKILHEIDIKQSEIHAASLKHLEDINSRSELKRQKLSEGEKELTVAAEDLSQKRSVLQEAKNHNETNLRLRQQALETIASAEAKYKEEALRHTELLKVEKTETDYLEMLRGFLGQIFAEILQEISNETNRILANLPNASKVTLKFETNRETQEGKTRNEITPVAYFGGRIWSLESGASGGMYTSIELAVDLAVGNIIAQRTGTNLGWLILDEAFANGSDKVTKEGCIEILKQYSDKKLIIIVEHASEFKEMFNRVIEIDYKNERSKIRC